MGVFKSKQGCTGERMQRIEALGAGHRPAFLKIPRGRGLIDKEKYLCFKNAHLLTSTVSVN